MSATNKSGVKPTVRLIRKFLTPTEANRLISAASRIGRQGVRNRLLLQCVYRHGLRVSELCDLRWQDYDLDALPEPTMLCRRLKGSRASTHTLDADEARQLRAWRRQNTWTSASHVFVSERLAPLTSDAVQKIVRLAGLAADLGDNVHPHMLRHACGYNLANAGVDVLAIAGYLGHRDVRNTQGYAALAPATLARVRCR